MNPIYQKNGRFLIRETVVHEVAMVLRRIALFLKCSFVDRNYFNVKTIH